jgi:hypothetical protein
MLCIIALGCFFSGTSGTVVAVGVKRLFAFIGYPQLFDFWLLPNKNKQYQKPISDVLH